jgi:hypothetical protein
VRKRMSIEYTSYTVTIVCKKVGLLSNELSAKEFLNILRSYIEDDEGLERLSNSELVSVTFVKEE